MGNRLAGKVIVITGGTKAIGKGIAFKYANENATVIINGRMQTPEDMAHGTVFLLSDEASQVTETELHINGGIGL